VVVERENHRQDEEQEREPAVRLAVVGRPGWPALVRAGNQPLAKVPVASSVEDVAICSGRRGIVMK
jgi:hypothetical protein